MNLTEARRILGLGADEDPRPYLDEFRAVREKIAKLVSNAPNEMLARRYQERLVEFDGALAVLVEYLEVLERGVPAKKGKSVFVSPNIVASPVGAENFPLDDATQGIGMRAAVVILAVFALIGYAAWTYFEIEEDRKLEKQARVEFLERQGAIFIENRRWPEARKAFDEIERIFPDSELVEIGLRNIEEGMIEEQNQFIGYWKGEAIAAFDAGRWDDSEKAARQVLDKYPDEMELNELIEKIVLAKVEEERQLAFDFVRGQIEKGKFDEAISGAERLIANDSADEEALALLKEANAAKEKAIADMMRARQLLALALERDTGEYDEEALKWLKEAVSLAPEDKTILASYEKMAGYTRTIRVPGDFETVQEALASARERDRLVIGEGTWVGPFVVTLGMELEGVAGKTIMQCAADSGSVITIGPGVRGARVSGMTIRHLAFDAGEDRYSLALVRGANADFSDCRFERGSGHGLAVTEGGHAKVLRCRFMENGWNGIAVIGAGSLLEAEGNTMNGNFQNGIESWDGAAVILSKNICTDNSRNGIHVDNGAASCKVLGNELAGNREFGMVLSSAGAGQVSGNMVRKNMLGGMVVKARSAETVVKENTITANQGPGLVLEKGLNKAAFTSNRTSGNSGNEVMADVEFPE